MKNGILLLSILVAHTLGHLYSNSITFTAFDWPNEIPVDCPFEVSEEFDGVRFLGQSSDYPGLGDTWYPTWANDDKLYSPFTDGWVEGDVSVSDSDWNDQGKENATTGQAIMIGNDPLNLTFQSLGTVKGNPGPDYGGRYPCGSLIYNDIWYYGTYCLGPKGQTIHEGVNYNWPIMGPMPGFRISYDFGQTWIQSPHTPESPLFPEPVVPEGPVKIGAPHFVDFGKNMEGSPDGKAYLIAHGSDRVSPPDRYGHNSWISGDQVYLLRVTPSPETINDLTAYEFYAGKDVNGNPVWTNNFSEIQPLLEWEDNMGCVTITWNAALNKYLMCVTDGWPTNFKMRSYIMESDSLTGPWRIAAYMKDFGEQAYFLNFPTKFIDQTDPRKMWLCYSGNFAPSANGQTIGVNPPGSQYGLVLVNIALKERVPTIDYNFSIDREGWLFNNDFTAHAITPEGELIMRVDSGQLDPFMWQQGLSFLADDAQQLFIRYKSETLIDTTWPQIFWETSATAGFDPTRVITPSQLFSDGDWTIARYDLMNHSGWAGQTITGLRIDISGVNLGGGIRHTWIDRITSDDITPFISDPESDDDMDGVAKLLEIALGGDVQKDDAHLVLPKLENAGPNFEYSFTKASDDFQYIVEYSHDLSQWNYYASLENINIQVGEKATIELPKTGWSEDKLFLRLVVTEQ